MSVHIPVTHLDLVTPPHILSVATLLPDGMPQLSLVWGRYEDDRILISFEKDSQKHRNLERDPKISLISRDPKNVWRYLEVRGLITEISLANPDWIDALSIDYIGEKYFGVIMAESRKDDIFLAQIKPTRVRAVGSSAE